MWPDRMALTGPFGELRREMDRLLDSFGVTGAPWRQAQFPALNVWDNGEAVFVEAELPGVARDDFEVYAVGNELTIKGRRRAQANEKKVAYQRQERTLGEFVRMLTLPCDVDADKVEAVLKDGVLTVQLPKAAAARPKRITVKTA
ncbi:MAG: Hsp20/alpha crystallin family protein [Phycisphaerae bacterium]|nr:Hsp20/alpha crystallin family protein [Phycisphaerae bacterium]